MDHPPHPGGRRKARTPQGDVNTFWSKFSRKRPSKVTSIFPRLLYASLLPLHPDPRGASSARKAAEGYDIAAKECRDKVRRIREECERTNEKFTDPDFDIETDFEIGIKWNCLLGLRRPAPLQNHPEADDVSVSTTILSDSPRFRIPGSVHRLDWIFRNPQFTVNGYSHTDVQQGEGGDCWLLAAISTIAHRKDLMDRICVARDEECGVYGFVFQRDGDWISTVVDDNLYLNSRDYREVNPKEFDPDGSKAEKFRSLNQRGSEALMFSRCTEQNETWLPLLEKAFAKAHGDYQAVNGGYVGDGVEDMTGGVTTPIATNRVLRKERLWREMSSSDGQFMFGLSTSRRFDEIRGEGIEADSGVTLGHAYTILRAVEVDTEDGKSSVRLVKVRNPWGKRDPQGRIGEWNGRWSDGSEEWTPYWMEKLDHRFKDDGIFWMEYGDMLQTYSYIYRTRLFNENWSVIQQWASCSVSWVTGYLRTKFVFDVKKAGMVVIVMAQLDDRYFRGLEGKYRFNLHFILRKQGSQVGDYLCRVRPVSAGRHRSVSCEIDLEEGQYEVVPQITAERNGNQAVETVIPAYADLNPQKLRQVGLQYDLAHAKGGIPDEDMKIEQQKSKPKKKAHFGRPHPRIRGTYLEFDVGIMSPQEPVPSDESDGRSDGQAELEQFQDATESPSTVGHPCDCQEGDESGAPGHKPREKLTVDTDRSETQKGGLQDAGEHREPARAEEPPEMNGNAVEADPQPGRNTEVGEHEHAEAESVDGHPHSDSGEDDDGQWNAVCVACLRVYSRDPGLTITLVDPEESQGGSNLVSGLEPAGATM